MQDREAEELSICRSRVFEDELRLVRSVEVEVRIRVGGQNSAEPMWHRPKDNERNRRSARGVESREREREGRGGQNGSRRGSLSECEGAFTFQATWSFPTSDSRLKRRTESTQVARQSKSRNLPNNVAWDRASDVRLRPVRRERAGG